MYKDRVNRKESRNKETVKVKGGKKGKSMPESKRMEGKWRKENKERSKE